MEPYGSREPAASAPTSNEADTKTTASAGTTATTPDGTAESPARQDSARSSLIVVAIAGVCLGGAMVLAFAGVSADEPVSDQQAIAAPVVTAPAGESTPPPTWAGSRRAAWAHDGSKTIAFTLAATHDLPVWMSKARPALIVRCQYRATEAFVALDTSTSYEQDADRRTVTVQWDDEPQSAQGWGVSESARELFAPDGVSFVRRAANARTLRFGFTPFNAPPVVAEFAVDGFDQLAELVANTCGWRLTPPQDRTN